MKTFIAVLLFLVSVVSLEAQWRYSGDAYAGGGARLVRVEGVDGEYEYIQTAVGEGGFTFSYNNGYWFGGLSADAIRDDYYLDITGKMSLAMVDPLFGTYRFYTSYRVIDDRTDFDNDSTILSFYGEGLKRLDRDTSINVSGLYSTTRFSKTSSISSNYDTISAHAVLNYRIFSVRIGTENTTYDDASVLPDSTMYRVQAYANYYSDSWLSYTSLSYQTKDYNELTDVYKPYNQIDFTTRSGYRISADYVPYLTGSYVIRNTDVFMDTDTSYRQWKAGFELNMFTHPLKLIAKIGRKEFEENGFLLSERDYATTDLEAEWSYWSGTSSLTLSHKREIQTFDAINGFGASEYDYTKDDSYMSVGYEWSSDVRSEFRTSRTHYAYSIETPIYANYTRYSIGIVSDCRLSPMYTLALDTEYSAGLYETYDVYDTHELFIKLLLKASF